MKNTILLTCAIGLMVGSASADVTISYLGADTTNAGTWRSTSVAKNATFDADGDNAYGTAGYAIPNTSLAAGSALTPSNWVTDLPGFVTLTVSSGNYWHNAVYPDIDNPTLPIAATVGDLTNPPTGYNTPSVTFTLTSAQDFVFSVLSNHIDSGQGPGILTLTGPGGVTASVTNTSTLVGMYFFDMKGFQANDTFTLTATTTGSTGGKFTAVAFDVVPEPTVFQLAMTPAIAPATGFDLEWESQAGKLYNLRTSTDLANPISGWDLVEGDIVATPPTNVENVDPADPRRFYAVEEFAAPPPEPLSFKDSSGSTWLDDISFGVSLTGQPSITTHGASRYTMHKQVNGQIETYSFSDSNGVLDIVVTVETLSERSRKIMMKVTNISSSDLVLDNLTLLSGIMPGVIKTGQSNVLLNGIDSWSGYISGQLSGSGAEINSYYTLALQSPEFAAGFLTNKKNMNRFTVTDAPGSIRIKAWGECNNVTLAAGTYRETDQLFVSAEESPLNEMERYADLAAVANNVALWQNNFATWCSWYTGWMRDTPLYSYLGGLEAGIVNQKTAISNNFTNRSAASMRIVDDAYAAPYGDWTDTTPVIPNGFARLAGLLEADGIIPGVWYTPFVARHDSQLAQNHHWLAKNNNNATFVDPEFSNWYKITANVLDASVNDVVVELEDKARLWRERGFDYVMTDFLKTGAYPPEYHDDFLTKVEIHVRGLEALSRGFGDAYWLGCGALLGPSMGYCDGVRISNDSHGSLPDAYLWSGARWFYNHRVWLNDPDAIVFKRSGQNIRSLEYCKMWTSWQMLTGGVITYADLIGDLPSNYLEIYKKAFPPVNTAGRPLDLWENNPFQLLGMKLNNGSLDTTLFGVFNLSSNVQSELLLNLDEISARTVSFKDKPALAPEKYILWDFWQEKLYEPNSHTLSIARPSRLAGRLFVLRERKGIPQLLATSGHFTQGHIEVTAINWDENTRKLQGQVKGNGGDSTKVYFYVPDSYTISSALLGNVSVTLIQKEERVWMLQVPAAMTPESFVIEFAGQTLNPSQRPFVPGKAITVE